MATLAVRGQTVPNSSPAGAWSGSPSLAGALNDGAPGTNPASYVVWASNVSLGVGYIEVSGYGYDTGLSAGDTLTSVTATVRHQESATLRFSSVNVQAWSGGVAIGTSFNCGLATSVRTDTASLGTITLAQLRSTDFTVRVTGTRTTGTTGSNFFLDYVDVTATYTGSATGRPMVHNGTTFVPKPLKVFNGTVWVQKPVKVYTAAGTWKTLT
jgi:hypothetical protein